MSHERLGLFWHYFISCQVGKTGVQKKKNGGTKKGDKKREIELFTLLV